MACRATAGIPHLIQGSYNTGKHGNLREFVDSGNLGNLKFNKGILVYYMLFFVTQSETHNKPT